MAVAPMSAENLPSAPARSLRVTLVMLTLAVFAAVVAFVTWQLRG